MKRKILMLALLLSIITSGCNKNQQEEIPLQYFEIDSSTNHINRYAFDENNDYEINNNVENENNEPSFDELTITGDDNSVSYKIDGNDVIYNGVRYVDLYKNINELNTKYNHNTLLNFIIKIYKADSDKIYTAIYDETKVETDEYSSVTLDEEFSASDKYIKLRDMYNDKITWYLSIRDSETGDTLYIYGCNSYLMVNGNGYDINIDMSEYDSSVK